MLFVHVSKVVTLVHFYCGLRQFIKKGEILWRLRGVVTLVHFYCGLRLFRYGIAAAALLGSNPCPFLLWIAT